MTEQLCRICERPWSDSHGVHAGDPCIPVETFGPTAQVPCVCGLPLAVVDADTDQPWWTHKFPAPRCFNAVPAAGMPTRKDREVLTAQLTTMDAGLLAVGRDLQDLRHALDDVDEAVKALNAQLISPSVVRRATLNQVWDRLVDEGHMAAAAMVMKMIQRVVDDK